MPEMGDAQPQAQKSTAAALQDKLNQGMTLHRHGKLADAERCYGEVLQRQPDHFGALHLLGVIARQTRRTERAVELIKRAIELNPKLAAAHINLGNALMDLQRSAEALASYDKAIVLNPGIAEAHYNRGNALMDLKHPTEALASYDRSIALTPEYAEAHNNHGNVLRALTRPTEALASYDKAIALKPDYAEAHYNRGNALMDLKHPTEALASYDRSIALTPEYAEAHNNRGNVLRALTRPTEALASYDKAIALKPDYEAYNNRGNALKDLTRPAEALASYDRAIALKPDYAEAHSNRGAALMDLKRPAEALASCDRAIALKPDYAEAHYNRGNALMDLTRPAEALASYDRAIALKPDYAEAHSNRGNALMDLKRPEEALASYDRAIALKPDFDLAWLGRGNALIRLKDFEHALAAFDSALASNPGLAAAWINRGNVLNELKRYEDATAAYDSAINLDPTLADAYRYKAYVKLCIGDFASGWDLYEWRSKAKEYVSSYPHLKALNITSWQERSAFIGKRVAVFSEQGVGDEIMFASILPDLINDANTVFYQVDPRLVLLFERSFPTAKITARGNANNGQIPEQAFDVVIQAGSLGYAYRREAASFPRLPYLKAESTKVGNWQARLSREAGSRPRIGISWRGGTALTRRDDRSIDLERVRPLIERDDCYFISLQYGDVGDELAKFNSGAGKVHSLLDDFNNLDEFAALITALDVVISVQNTTIHMSGALGKTCWGMVPWQPEWRYGDRDKSMIWYSTVELFRQKERGDWSGVLDLVSSHLAAYMRGRTNDRAN